MVISLTSEEAASREYIWLASYLERASFCFFVNLAIVFYLYFPRGFTRYSDTHASCSTSYHFHGRFYSESIKVRHFRLSDHLHLIPGYRSHFFSVWLCRTAFELRSFQQQVCSWRSFYY